MTYAYTVSTLGLIHSVEEEKKKCYFAKETMEMLCANKTIGLKVSNIYLFSIIRINITA